MEMPIYTSLPPSTVSHFTYNVRASGVVGNGIRKETQAIQHVIDRCAEHGGGTIYFPAGTYLTGSLRLRSFITLYLDAGAILLFSPDFEDYPPVQTRWEGIECYGFSPLIYGNNLDNISLIGRGTLDGQGTVWWKTFKERREQGKTGPETELERELARLNTGYEPNGSGGGGRETQFLRPPLVQFMNCRNVCLEGLIHQNSPFWNTHLVYCENVVIRGMTFKNPPNAPNTDGLDIDSCRNVRIADCYFDVGDDCLCLKSGMDTDGRRVGKPTENVTITNCTMLHGHGGVVIGSEIAGSVRNVAISNCIFLGTDRGIRLKARRGRGGIVEDLRVSNILMKRVLSPIVMNMFYRCGAKPEDWYFSPEPQLVTETTPIFRNIAFANITAREVRAAAGFLHGLPEMPIQEVRFHDMLIEMSPLLEDITEPPAMMFGLEPMAGKGIWGKYLQDVQFAHVRVETQQGEGLFLEESRDIEIYGFSLKNFCKEAAGIILNQVENACIHACPQGRLCENFLQLQGQQTRNIFFNDRYFTHITQGFLPRSG
jgi:polygalacturonase